MPHYKCLYPSKYLNAADIMDACEKSGKDGVTITIEKIQGGILETERGEEEKTFVTLKGTKKKWIMGIESAHIIADLYDETDWTKWIGLRVILYPTKTKSFGKIVDCIRPRNRMPDNGQAPDRPKPQPPKARTKLDESLDEPESAPVTNSDVAGWVPQTLKE